MKSEDGQKLAIAVDGESLVMATYNGKSCLDINTGEILPEGKCDPAATGDGQDAVKSGKRYIRIPLVQTPDLPKWESCEQYRQRRAEEWISSIQPPLPVVWMEVGGWYYRVYEPGQGWDYSEYMGD